MVRKRAKKTGNIAVEAYSHKGKKRKNNPPVGLVSSATDKLDGITNYKHDPHIDPQLSWAGKAEGVGLSVRNVSLHIHERIEPSRIIKSFLKEKPPTGIQLTFFDNPANELPLSKAIDFYHHDHDWANRLIAGDSLLVMNSLLIKEGMAGKVQMAYIDPPYGIKYNSNFQPFVNKRDVRDGNDADIPAEPEMIQAFRDTWELGIHSYLTHLRDRLLLVKELLHESGSCFVQISDENVHHVQEIMDEVFGKRNFCSLIPFIKKTMPFGSNLLEQMNDFIVWYAIDKKKVKYRQLFVNKSPEGDFNWRYYETLDRDRHELTKEQIKNHSLIPKGSKLFRLNPLEPSGLNKSGQFDFEWNGKIYKHPRNGWGTNPDGMQKLKEANRIHKHGQSIAYVLYLDDYPVTKVTAPWHDVSWSKFQEAKIYVVQTSTNVLQRCILMTTDPGDLVLDPTCGAGTTAYVAEKWGRRWVTCDTSRVAITLAKQRLMTAKFGYYALAHSNEGVRSGFKYNIVPHITLKSIANNELPQEETLYDQPFVEKSKVRVTGPFTVEAVPSSRVKPFDGSGLRVKGVGCELARVGETGKQSQWRDELKATGIRTTGNKIVSFSRVEPMIATRFLHAEGEILERDGTNRRAYISFGPDYGPLEQRQVEEAVKEARKLKEKPDFVIFAAFHFDPEAAKDIDQISWPGVKLLKTQMSVDLLTSDLRKKRSSNQSYWLIGQPDVEVSKHKDGKCSVSVNGFDYYDPISGEIISKGTKHIAMWFLDTDYDERSLLPEQVFFPDSDKKRDWTRLAKALKTEVNEVLLESFSGTESLPFEAGEQKKIAVKIIDNRGIESFVIKNLE